MKCVIDTSVVLAVVLGEAERAWAIEATKGAHPFAPHSFLYEIGNALSALVKRKRLSQKGALAAWTATQAIPVTLRDIDMPAAIGIAVSNNLYAYDAYMIRCAVETNAVLLTLDRRLAAVAKSFAIPTLDP